MSPSKFQVPRSKILFLVGPTASGKSDLAMKLANELDGEIVAADSQTVRRELNIGTAKPSKADMSEVKHHLINIVGPFEEFSVATFQKLAKEAIKDIKNRGKLPIVVGGTGLYVDSLFYDYSLEVNDLKERKELENKTAEDLQKIIEDKNYQMPRNKQNPRHLIGTIIRKGVNPEDIEPINGVIIYGIKTDSDVLKKRINDRVELMFEQGLIEEVKELSIKYDGLPDRVDAIGYPIVNKYLNNEIKIEQAKELMKKSDWQYARRQIAWFKRNKYINWIDNSEESANQIIEQIIKY